MEEDERLLDLNGKVRRHTTSSFEVRPGPDGKPRPFLVKATRKGEDVTEERREENAKREKKGDEIKDVNNIFHPSWYGKNRVTRTGLTETIEGHTCIAFEFLVNTDDGSWSGVLFLQEETGIPRKIVAIPDKLPERKKVKTWDASFVFHYKYNAPDDWYLDRLVVEAKFRTLVAYIIPFTGRALTVVRFLDYAGGD